MRGLTQQSITVLQYRLGMMPNGPNGGADGVYGLATREACERFGLPLTDGAPTPETFESFVGMGVDTHGNPDWLMQINGNGRFVIESRSTRAAGVPGSLTPRGWMIHHTGNGGDAPRCNAELMSAGRSDLSGPLYNFVVNRDLSVLWVTNGRTHHAGMGDGRVLAAVERGQVPPIAVADDTSGNSYFLSGAVDGRPGQPTYEQQCRVAGLVIARMDNAAPMPARMGLIRHANWTARKTDVSKDGFVAVLTGVAAGREPKPEPEPDSVYRCPHCGERIVATAG